MERSDRDFCIARFNTFVKRDKKGRLKYRLVAIKYLENLMGCHEIQYIDPFGGFVRKYDSVRMLARDYFSPFNVHIYFPYEGFHLICSIIEAQKINYINNILNEQFEEKPIVCRWIGHYKEVIRSSKIIISMARTDSILLDNGKSLLNTFKRI